MDLYFLPILITGALAGIGIGLLGVFIVGMRIPFIGTCISHAAMVGAVYASLFGVNPTWGAICLSMAGSAGMACLPADHKKLDTNTNQAVFLAFMMGLVFLAVGLEQDSRSEMLSLLWGSVLFAGWDTVILTGSLTLVLGLFICVFNKELKSILFSRSLAQVSGPYMNWIYFIFLCLCGLILAVNLKAVGGLLIFSLLVCPASAAYQICKGHKTVIIISILFGVLSSVLGFLMSYYLSLPTGACTVLTSTSIFFVCSVWSARTAAQ